MRKKQFHALLALNLALVALLAAVSLAPRANAQRGARARGQYTMVAGEVQGMEEAAVYIVDSNNQQLVALHWDQGAHGLAPIGSRDLRQDAQAPTGAGR